MLITYDSSNGDVIDIVTTEGYFVTPELIDSLKMVDPLPVGHREYRVYDTTLIKEVLAAEQRGDTFRVNINEQGEPTGITIDSTNTSGTEKNLPTLEERIQALEQLELMRLFGGGDV